MKSYKCSIRYALALAALFACFNVGATNPPNPCGNHGNNCNPPTTGGDSTTATGVGVGIGVGVGYGEGGNANASNTNTNAAIANGGNATQGQLQGQQQGQGQSQTGVVTGVNGQQQGIANSGNSAATANGGAGGNSSATNAGNAQSTSITLNEAAQPDDVTIRAAPSVYATAPAATASCYKTYGAGLSGLLFGGFGAQLAGGSIDERCDLREIARLSDPVLSKKLMCLFEEVQLADRAGCAGVPILYQLSKAQRKQIVMPGTKK